MVSGIDPTKPRDGVPASKSDLRANLHAAKTEIEELQLKKIQDGMPFDMKGSHLTQPVLKNHAEVAKKITVHKGQLIIDLTICNVFEIMIDQNVTSLILEHSATMNQAHTVVIIMAQNEIGGWSVAWPESVMWAGGGAPAISSNPSTKDVYAFLTTNGGTSWFGFVGGQMFS